MKVLVVSMVYGYSGPLHNGMLCNSNIVGTYQRVLNNKSAYEDQVKDLIGYTSIDLSDQLQRDPYFNPVALGYLHIISHSVTVIDHE